MVNSSSKLKINGFKLNGESSETLFHRAFSLHKKADYYYAKDDIEKSEKFHALARQCREKAEILNNGD